MRYYSNSVSGMVRIENEDSCVVKKISENCILAIVADGMGGHRGGKKASSVALNSICGYIEKNMVSTKKYTESKIRKLLEAAASEANREIFECSEKNEEFRGMGTTVVVCLMMSERYYVISAGDSRMYLNSKDSLAQITKDHSYVAELVELGLISKEDARNHPNKNVITRALGAEKTIEFDFYTGNLNSGETILICSDGLSNMVSDEEILEIIKKHSSPEDIVQKLVNMANENGGTDNISVVVISADEKGGDSK